MYVLLFSLSHLFKLFYDVCYLSSGPAPPLPGPMAGFCLTCRNHSLCFCMATCCLAGFLLISIPILSFISISFLFLPQRVKEYKISDAIVLGQFPQSATVLPVTSTNSGSGYMLSNGPWFFILTAHEGKMFTVQKESSPELAGGTVVK